MVAISDALCSTVISDDGLHSPRVYYFDSNSHVRELIHGDEYWGSRDITQDSNVPSLAMPASPLCCTTVREGEDRVPRVYYYDKHSHIWQLAYKDGRWQYRDVSKDSGALRHPVLGSPLCCTTVIDSAVRIYYREHDAHICEIAYTSDGWTARDITETSGTSGHALPSTPLCCTSVRSNGRRNPCVYYLDEQYHVWELAYVNEKWRSKDITEASGAPGVVAPDSPLCCIRVSEGEDRVARVYYFDSQHHVWELAYVGGKWHSRNVTQSAGTISVVAPDSSLSCYRVTEGDRFVPRVHYVDTDSHVNELAYTNNGWQHGDITAASRSPVVAANSTPLTSTTVANAAIRVYHFDSYSHVWELGLTSSGWRNRNLVLAGLRITVHNIDTNKIDFPALNDKNILLDVWGEGRINALGITTGFDRALNLNDRNQAISNGPDMGKPISNLVPVYDYDNPEFPIDSGLVSFITLMGAPITEATAKEMHRVLNKSWGMVILYDPSDQHRANFERHMGNLVLKPNSQLPSPFNQVTITPAYIYGFPDAPNQTEI